MYQVPVQTEHAEPVGTPSPCRILALQGGGLRGIVSAAALCRLEELGQRAYGESYQLSDSYDLVGGTSVGAVLAVAIALGLPTRQMVGFFLDQAPKGFRRRRFAVPGLHHMFDASELRRNFACATNGHRLLDRNLKTGLCVVVKSLSCGTPLMLSNATTGDGVVASAQVLRRDIALDDLLRATTAAPGLFDPVCLPVGPSRTGAPNAGQALCVDGGLSPFNDPSYLLTRLATHTELCPRWARRTVDVTAIGTGQGSPYKAASKLLRRPAASLAIDALQSMVADGVAQTEALMTQMQGCSVSYRKYDLDLGTQSLESSGLRLTRSNLRQMRDFTNPKGKALMFEVAQHHMERLITQPAALKTTADSGQPSTKLV
ncbi:MAG: patatin-like phospholipase family protein [Pseudomonadota bacterium]